MNDDMENELEIDISMLKNGQKIDDENFGVRFNQMRIQMLPEHVRKRVFGMKTRPSVISKREIQQVISILNKLTFFSLVYVETLLINGNSV